jgi:hypothetical protein
MYDGSEGETEIAIRRGISSSNSASRRILKPRTACRLADGIEEGCHGCSDCYVDQIFLYGVRNLEWCGWPTRHHGHHGAGQDRGAITRVRSSPSLSASVIYSRVYTSIRLCFIQQSACTWIPVVHNSEHCVRIPQKKAEEFVFVGGLVTVPVGSSDRWIVGLLDRRIVGSLDRWLLV